MSDYYDRLEQQLMRATARPSPRARRAPIVLWRPRRDLYAVAASLAVVAIVAAIFIGLRPSTRHVTQPPAQHGLAVVHNYGDAAMPALLGYECKTKLLPPPGGRPLTAPDLRFCNIHDRTGRTLQHPRASGTVSVSVKPGGEVFSIDALGLPRSPRDSDYAVWLLSGRQNTAGNYTPISGQKPTFVGIVTPPVGASGRLRAQGLIPTLSAHQATGHYLFAVTRQAHPSNKSLGRIVLEGWLSF